MSLHKLHKKHKFEVQIKLQELINIPHTLGKCYVQIAIANKRNQSSVKFSDKTPTRPIANHKCTWDHEIKTVVKWYEDSQGNMSDKWLILKFHSVLTSNELLGMLELNLTEYMNEQSEVTNRYLLQDSKVNSIFRMSIWIDSDAEYKVPPLSKDQIFQGLTNVIETESVSSGTEADNTNPKMLNGPVMNQLINKAYKFTWQFLGISGTQNYDEFTPAECVEDIFNYNGTGWKRNDDGVAYAELASQQLKYAKSERNETRWKYMDNDESEDERTPLKSKHYLPPKEMDIREDLRSWKINVSDIQERKI